MIQNSIMVLKKKHHGAHYSYGGGANTFLFFLACTINFIH